MTTTDTAIPKDHASDVLYPAIRTAMLELQAIAPGPNAINRAYNCLHRAFWSETPAPVGEPLERKVSGACAGSVEGVDTAIEDQLHVTGLTFGSALKWLKAGARMTRSGWNGKGLWLELQRPDVNSKMTLPYIFMSYPADAKTTPGARVPWLASQTDMLAEDWVRVE